MYFGSSESALIILVHLATWRGCSFCRVCLSAAKSHNAGGAKPVSLSLIPVNSFTCLIAFWMSSSICLMLLWYCPWPWNWINRFKMDFLRLFSINYLHMSWAARYLLHPDLKKKKQKEKLGLIAKLQFPIKFLPLISSSSFSSLSLTLRISSPKWSGILDQFDYEI